MQCKLPYGDREYLLEYPDERVKGVLEGQAMQCPVSEEAEVYRALDQPTDSAPLSQLVKKGEKACIIIGDVTRLWVRHHVLLPPIIDHLNRGGIEDEDILILSATGDHREHNSEEHRKLVGDAIYRRIKVMDHRTREKEGLVTLGNTSYGNEVTVNRNVVEADRVILTGGIVYHFLAGWGGGKKAIIPGVAGYDTIMRNHNLALHPKPGCGINPEVRAGKVEGNPCSDDMVQGASMIGPDFMVNSIINETERKIALVVAGNYLTAFSRGCCYVDQHMRVKIEAPAPLVIASCGGYPKDIDFYQTYKTIYNANLALEEGGTMILLTESREGIGNNDFANIFIDYDNNNDRETSLRHCFTIGGFMGYHSAIIAAEKRVLVLTDLKQEKVAKMGMIAINTLDEALGMVKEAIGGKLPDAYIMPHGGSTLPTLL